MKIHAFKHGWQQAGSLRVPSAFQRANDHCVELCTGGVRLCEPQWLGVQVEDARAGRSGPYNGDQERVVCVEGDRITHEG
jgi:hypothetical protein